MRGARGVVLTADGQCLFDRVAPHLDAIEQALRPFRARRDDVLTITLMPSFASSWLVPRLPRFLAAHPQLEINLQSTVSVVDFERETGIDAGLRYGPGEWPGLHAVHLFDDWVAPTASPELIARLGRPTLQTLGDFPLLGAPGGRWSDWFAHSAARAPKRFVANFDDSETLHRAAVEGLGIALGRLTLTRPMVEAGRLVHAVRRAAEGGIRALPGVSAALRAATAACRHSANGCCRKPSDYANSAECVLARASAKTRRADGVAAKPVRRPR